MGSEEHKLSSCRQRRLWSDRADAQANLSSLGAVILLILTWGGSYSSLKVWMLTTYKKSLWAFGSGELIIVHFILYKFYSITFNYILIIHSCNKNSDIHNGIYAAAWQNQQSDLCVQQRLRSAWALNYLLSAKWRLIRLGRCPGWSESSLGAHHFVGFAVAHMFNMSSLTIIKSCHQYLHRKFPCISRNPEIHPIILQ